MSIFTHPLRSLTFALLWAIVVLGGPAIVFAQTLPPQTITVETAADVFDNNGGACSLREALAYAQGQSVTDCAQSSSSALEPTIIFTNTLAGATIVVSPTLVIGNDNNIGSSLIISGNVPITISGGEVTRIFQITGYSSTITFDSLTLINGFAYGENGGALTFQGLTGSSKLTINNSTFVNNQAITIESCGLDDVGPCTIRGGIGGAIFFNSQSNPSTLNIINSTFRSNSAINTICSLCITNGIGGAISNTGGVLEIVNSILRDNVASKGGGAINSVGGIVTIGRSTFITNTANQSGGGGGAIFVSENALLTIVNSILSDNSASDLGGSIGYPIRPIIILESSPAVELGGGGPNIETIRISGSTLHGNRARSGGAIASDLTQNFIITNSTLSGNIATAFGGAIYNNSAKPSAFTIQHSTIVANRAQQGGGIYNSITSDMVLGANIIAGNSGFDCYNATVVPVGGIEASALQAVTSLGFNVINTNSDCTLIATDIVTAFSAVLIEPILANNGGDTPTHALRAGSPAIDAITDATSCKVTTDQRGAPRDTLCDIGAYEFPPSAIIGDRVWFDDNGNGIDDSESGIPNVTVNLLRNGGVIATAVTNATGVYSFTALSPGTYTVRVVTATLPTNFTLVQTHDPDPILDSATSTFVSADDTVLTADFGYQRLASISGRVWDDVNGNGTQETGEGGLTGVSVLLNGSITPTFTATDQNGDYRFAQLRPGTYTITVNSNSGALASGDYRQTGDPDGTFDHQTVIPLAVGVNVANQAFGYQELATMGDRVWLDLNADGMQNNNEPGLFGITVTLWIDTSGDNAPDSQITATRTSSDGSYIFRSLIPDQSYLVKFEDPYRRNFTRPGVQDDFVDSDANPVSGLTPTIVLTAGAANNDIDAGYLPAYRLSLRQANPTPDVGTSHTVTATVEALIESGGTSPSSQRVGNIAVRLGVRGVHQLNQRLTTDGNGNALLTYPYKAAQNLLATDTITAQVDLSQLPNVSGPTAMVMATWQPITMLVERRGIWIEEGFTEKRFMTPTVRSAAGVALAGLNVGFEVTQNNKRPAEFKVTGINGQVVFSYTSSARNTQVQANAQSEMMRQSTAQRSVLTPCNVPTTSKSDIITIWVDTDGNGAFNGTELFDRCEVASAITLADFRAYDNGDGTVTITWRTATEFDNAGFHLYRAETPDGPFVRITQQLIAAQGNGVGATYTFVDKPPAIRPLYYQLEDIDLQGKSVFHDPAEITTDLMTADNLERIFLPLLLR